MGFFGKLRKSVKYYKQFCKDKARQWRLDETRSRQNLAQAMERLQANPLDKARQSDFNDCAEATRSFVEQKLQGQRVRSRVKWIQHGDSCSKEFFAAHKGRQGMSTISELENDHGEICHEREALEQICISYYSSLYARGVNDNSTAEACEEALGYIEDRLTPEMKNSLRRPITLPELEAALAQTASRKAPGKDGVVIEFFKSHWELINMIST